MMNREEARQSVISEWGKWSAGKLPAGESASAIDGMVFFQYLQSEHPELLRFRYNGDKWQIVKSWLSRANLIPD